MEEITVIKFRRIAKGKCGSLWVSYTFAKEKQRLKKMKIREGGGGVLTLGGEKAWFWLHGVFGNGLTFRHRDRKRR